MADITYKKLSQHDKLLKRPNQVLGSVKFVQKKVWVAEDGEEGDLKIVEKEIWYNNGIIHLLNEILTNAQDNYFRSIESETPQKMIKINVITEGEISIWNDGEAIPIRIHEWKEDEDPEFKNKELYEHELIFGHFDSSGNFDDDVKKRTGAGIFGIGSKLTNLFSKEFIVEGHANGEKIVKKWRNNMLEEDPPKITNKKNGKDYTQITFTLDLQRFGCNELSQDMINVMRKMCIDTAVITGIKVYFNNIFIKPKNFMEYVNMYPDLMDDKVEFKSNDSIFIVAEKKNYELGIKQISFVNGIKTINGGVHLDDWTTMVCTPLLEKLRKKFKDIKLTNKNLYNYFMFFLKCDLENPEFDGNTKTVLESPHPDLELINGKLETKINKLLKFEFVNDIELTLVNKVTKEMKKTDGTKSKNVYIAKAIPSKYAGGPQSYLCTAIIVEGLSAKSLAVKAIATLPNKEYHGILAVRGKVLNPRTATNTQLANNEELKNIKLMLGLKIDKKYDSPEAVKTLRYGHLKIWTDADEDGDHIKGLIINFIHHYWPELIDQGYIVTDEFPLAIVTLKDDTLKNFYSIKRLTKYLDSATNVKKVKYLKGLGSIPDENLASIMKTAKKITYLYDEKAGDYIDMIFSGKRALEKKKWLETPELDIELPAELPLTTYFDKSFKTFSFYSNARAIANVVDGLKPSQRKVLWAALHSLNRTSELKVSQFSGEASNKSGYRHGSLDDVIIRMAQTFLGSNNMTFLEPIGQFGEREEGGYDHAAPRYINVKLSNMARKVFRKEDDAILTYLKEEGMSIEPKYFYPIIPTILINGCDGIGWAYCTHFSSYNLHDLINWIKGWLNSEKYKNELIPWFWNFKGRVVKENNKWVTYGCVTKISDGIYKISELAIGCWTSNYIEFLQELKEKKIILKYEPIADTFDIDITVYLPDDFDLENIEEILKLKKYLTATSNSLAAFTPEGVLKQYQDINEVMETFCKERYEAYIIRKKHIINEKNEAILEAQSKKRYIELIRSDTNILLQTEKELEFYLEENNYYRPEGGFSYLTNIRNGNFTNDKKEELEKQIKNLSKNLEQYKKITVKEMWIQELDECKDAYEEWKSNILEIRKTLKSPLGEGKKKKKR